MEDLKGKKVKCYKFGRDIKMKLIKELAYEATFLEFGLDYEEFESGGASFSVGLVLLEDGCVKSVPVDLIKFNSLKG